jgi:hypothetical protein
MTTTPISAPARVQSIGRTLRMLLAAAAILVLLGAAFVVGRVTVSSTSAPGKAPAASTQVPGSNSGICQQVGHLRSTGC